MEYPYTLNGVKDKPNRVIPDDPELIELFELFAMVDITRTVVAVFIADTFIMGASSTYEYCSLYSFVGDYLTRKYY